MGSTLSQVSEGDLRKGINCLQSCYGLYGGKCITSQCIEEISGVVPHHVVEHLFQEMKNNSFDALETEVRQLISNGYPATKFISQVNI